MAGPTDVEEAAILDGLFGSYTPPATRYLALSTTTPAEAGTGFTEVGAGVGYARIATTTADWSAAVGGAPTVKTNSATLSFPVASGDWGICTYMGVYDVSPIGTGVLKWFGLLIDPNTGNPAPKHPQSSDVAIFSPGSVIFKLGDPADSY